ncbi:TRAP transporter small permease [Aureimonas phyllosphaerae]|uniref:TRAP transporter small permease n=1 Tax=Aureimonas phyllosphaerae TaxID=1166078 RepID=UPI003A5C4129
MHKAIDVLFKLFEALMVVCLAGMVVMVFGNAVLRKLSDYGLVLFGGGITVSEEVSRIFFVWLTFVGAVVVARDGSHMGVETFVARFGPGGRKVLMLATNVLIVICCAVFFWGTWRQTPIHSGNYAPITGISMIWVYGVGFVASVGMGLVAAAQALRIATGRISEAEVRKFAGEFEDDLAETPKGRAE